MPRTPCAPCAQVFADQQRLALYSQAAVELGNDKQLCLALAREHGVQADYARELKVCCWALPAGTPICAWEVQNLSVSS